MGQTGPKPDPTALKPNQMGFTASTLPAGGYGGEFPKLLGTHARETHLWYLTWARSPQAAVFLSTDWQRLQMMAILVDSLYDPNYDKPKSALMAEMRQNEAKLGATVADRMSLYMKVATPLGNQPPVADVTDGDEELPPLEPVQGRQQYMHIVSETG